LPSLNFSFEVILSLFIVVIITENIYLHDTYLLRRPRMQNYSDLKINYILNNIKLKKSICKLSISLHQVKNINLHLKIHSYQHIFKNRTGLLFNPRKRRISCLKLISTCSQLSQVKFLTVVTILQIENGFVWGKSKSWFARPKTVWNRFNFVLEPLGSYLYSDCVKPESKFYWRYSRRIVSNLESAKAQSLP
jgi:hypothetical protein